MSEPFGISRSADDGAVDAGVARHRRSESTRHREQAGSPHASRFRSVTALLVAIGIGALVIAGAIAIAGRGTSKPAQKWSQWQPSDQGTLGARDIADFVAPFYRIDNIHQLAVVTVVNLESAAAAAAQQQAAANGTTSGAVASGLQVAVRPSPTSSQVSLLNGNTIAYNLCGIGGKNCAIGVGKPSTNRLLLLRREALELALYTFKYIGGTQNVVAILPPGPHRADQHPEQEAAERPPHLRLRPSPSTSPCCSCARSSHRCSSSRSTRSCPSRRRRRWRRCRTRPRPGSWTSSPPAPCSPSSSSRLRTVRA